MKGGDLVMALLQDASETSTTGQVIGYYALAIAAEIPTTDPRWPAVFKQIRTRLGGARGLDHIQRRARRRADKMLRDQVAVMLASKRRTP